MRYLDDVLELINSQNPLRRTITQDNVFVSLPDDLIPETVVGQGDRNASIVLEGRVNHGYKGATKVYYTRLDLHRLFEGEAPKIRSRHFDQQMLLDIINLQYGLNLQSVDVKNHIVPTFDDSPLETSKNYTLEVVDNSYRWVGKVDIELRYGNPRIEPLIMVQLLPMLSHPANIDTLGGRNYGNMATYGFDFTFWKDDLTIDPETGLWNDFAEVQRIGALAGLGYWYNGPVVDLPTSAVEDANQTFQRVMIQYTPGGLVSGAIYFHYDSNW